MTKIKKLIVVFILLIISVNTVGVLDGNIGVDVENDNKINEIKITATLDKEEYNSLRDISQNNPFGVDIDIRDSQLSNKTYIKNELEQNIQGVNYQNSDVNITENENKINYNLVYKGITVKESSSFVLRSENNNITYAHNINNLLPVEVGGYGTAGLVEFNYTVNMPSKVVEHNGDVLKNQNTVVWENINPDNTLIRAKSEKSSLLPNIDISGLQILVLTVSLLIIVIIGIFIRSRRGGNNPEI